MKNLKKIERSNLKFIKGGISLWCAEMQASATRCYAAQDQCLNDGDADGQCLRYCNKWCY